MTTAAEYLQARVTDVVPLSPDGYYAIVSRGGEQTWTTETYPTYSAAHAAGEALIEHLASQISPQNKLAIEQALHRIRRCEEIQQIVFNSNLPGEQAERIEFLVAQIKFDAEEDLKRANGTYNRDEED